MCPASPHSAADEVRSIQDKGAGETPVCVARAVELSAIYAQQYTLHALYVLCALYARCTTRMPFLCCVRCIGERVVCVVYAACDMYVLRALCSLYLLCALHDLSTAYAVCTVDVVCAVCVVSIVCVVYAVCAVCAACAEYPELVPCGYRLFPLLA